MSTTGLMILLIVSIAVLLLMVLKFKINASLALIVAALVMGIGSGMGEVEVANGIAAGFGSFMQSSGLSIGFGIILGQLVYDYGGATSIARGMVKAFPKNKSLFALAFASFIISIPVFFDVTFILLVPLGIAMSQELKKPIHYIVIALVAGGVTTHSLVPPTPAPLSAAGILNFDVGVMIIVGAVVGFISMMLVMKIMFHIMDKGFWKKDTDEMGEIMETEVVPPLCGDKPAPNMFVSMLPILTPVVLILLNTIWGMAASEVPEVIQFLGDKTVSMMLGTFVAMLIGMRNLSGVEMEISANESLKAAGLVLLITGAGSSFGNILTMCGVSDAIVSSITGISSSPILVLLITYGIGMLLRIAQGSATVAGVTALNIMAATVAAIDIHPVFIAMAALAGGFSVGHVNDSGFWIMTNRCGFSVKGGLKCITLTELVLSLLILAFTIILAVVVPSGFLPV